ncbi:hypothetical protein CONLIGDRAFT_244650 [Coniochaeta ligniaria NRRL 30616]|uniref:Uncharacterized protein n=1 Tax=Coniochaeta ligniaria NRRL 30616 TaxID=1408157 RepID=A0A1J7JVV5_9PEZI|nr:hypothetical protein CONLIGDRAFT_244650 [Coniochaeta ligniaria NRRL 30616]
MKYEATILALAGFAAAREVGLYTRMGKREVPQEHSHEAILRIVNTNLQLNNPLAIQDTVFGLLGNKAAAEGAPNVANLDCLQQIIADQAFTNAKAAGDLEGQANAILFRALERNTGSVGLESVLCNETAVNPEIAAITQHQDPASKSAAGNKDIALAVATQLASIGADPNLAIQTGTFAPGQIGDPTAKGNTCDVADDAAGCIISQNLLVPDVSEAEIKAAVADVAVSAGAAGAAAGAAASAASNASAAAAPAAAPAAAAAAAPAAAGAVNVQTFTGALGGAAPPVEFTAGADRPFAVDGSTFLNQGAALQRSCSVQHNACANAANSGAIAGSSAQCETQQAACEAAAASKRRLAVRTSSKARRAALDTGSCGSPAIEFAVGLDGRKEASFQAVNQADFNHGSALNIKVISDFICQQLSSKCDAAAATVSACDAASAAAQAAAGGKAQASADAFNSALGV